jgi:hypothetical protein
MTVLGQLQNAELCGRRSQRRRDASSDAQIFCRFLAAVGDDVVADLGALGERAEASVLNGRDVYEHVLAAAIRLDEAVALGGVKPFHWACSHVD